MESFRLGKVAISRRAMESQIKRGRRIVGRKSELTFYAPWHKKDFVAKRTKRGWRIHATDKSIGFAGYLSRDFALRMIGSMTRRAA